MRNNQPVSEQEYKLAIGTVLVSRTDAKGILTYANEDFVAVSGFTKEELYGQPHNIVRHPTMPQEAFRDMWHTLKSGRPWSGLVKNRRKNGDYYWVRANVNPSSDGGYRSVRTAPSQREIDQACALYSRMETDTSMRLDEGRPYQKGWLTSALATLNTITLMQRLLLWLFSGGFLWLYVKYSG